MNPIILTVTVLLPVLGGALIPLLPFRSGHTFMDGLILQRQIIVIFIVLEKVLQFRVNTRNLENCC